MTQDQGQAKDLRTVGRKPECVQPGGGTCMRLEEIWGRVRRADFRSFRRGYVRLMLSKLQGECSRFAGDVIDPRDLKYIRNVCGFWFDPKDDHFAWRGKLGLARYGLAEVILFSVAFFV